MRFQLITVLGMLSFMAGAQADDLVEDWKVYSTAAYSDYLQSAISDGVYRADWNDSEQERHISKISSKVISCWADMYVSLAKLHDVDLSAVFVNPQRGLVNTDMFSRDEVDEKTRSCVRHAFDSSGLQYD